MKNNSLSSHNHRSLRLKGYDYSSEGLYFITICTKHRQHFFGEIDNGQMNMSEIGSVADMFIRKVPIHFSHALVTEHVVMPNHVHLILVLNDKGKSANDEELIDNGKMHGVGTFHGMSLQATGDGPVGTRHGVSPPPAVSPPPVRFL
jgi:hypothetical protein